MGAIKFQSIQGFWAQLQAQALTAKDVFSAGSLAHAAHSGGAKAGGEHGGGVHAGGEHACGEHAGGADTGARRETGLRSVAEIIADYRGGCGTIPEVAHTAGVDAFLMHGEISPASFAGSELVGCVYRCDSAEPVA